MPLRKPLEIVLWGLGIIGLGVVGLILVALIRWDRTFAAPYPEIHGSADTAVIAHGRYLVYGPAHCASCHVPLEDSAQMRNGAFPPLRGGFVFDIPPGKFHVPNLTPDSATGIGRRTDGELARMLRHDVRADGRSALPFMTAQDFSDEDLTAVISFLRSQPPIRHEVPAHELTLMGKIVMAFMIKPKGPTQPTMAASPRGPSLENGRYLAHSVAACVSCHTARSMMTGAYTGPLFAGSEGMPVEGKPGVVAVPPNLTPDSATGRIASWSEDAFIGRFRSGRSVNDSPMPWEFYGRMSDDDLRAIYRYLKTVPAVRNETGPSIRTN